MKRRSTARYSLTNKELGRREGEKVGLAVREVGDPEGCEDGWVEGSAEGWEDGELLGWLVGKMLGDFEGLVAKDGAAVDGAAVGKCVGSWAFRKKRMEVSFRKTPCERRT